MVMKCFECAKITGSLQNLKKCILTGIKYLRIKDGAVCFWAIMTSQAVSRWGNDSPEHWYNSATMLHTFLLTMKGTPYFYYGDEIGMTNVRFDSIDDYRDINTLNRYELLKDKGIDLDDFIANEKEASRDNARTPMQWDSSKNAGFSEVRPWLKVNTNHKKGLNVAEQEKKKDSVLNYFKRMVQIRKNHLGLVYGNYQLLLEDNEQIYAYTRSMDNDKYLVLLSFSEDMATFQLKNSITSNLNLLISNDTNQAFKNSGDFELNPYQACVYKIS